MSFIIPKRKLIKKAIPLLLCAPLILPITAFKPNIIKKEPFDQYAMFMPLMGSAAAAGKYTAPPASGYKGKLVKSTNTTIGSTITFSSVDIGTIHNQRIGVFAWSMAEGAATNTDIVVGGTTLDYTDAEAVWQASPAGNNNSIVMRYLALDSGYGTTTTITHGVAGEDEPGFVIMYWIIYPSSPTPITSGSNENNTGTTVISGSYTTQVGGLATMFGATGDTSGLSGAITTGSGSLVESDTDQSIRSTSAFTITCDGSSIAVTLTRDLGTSSWKGLLGYTWARAY